MNDRIRCICLDENASIKDLMQSINEAPRHNAPSGIALIVDGDDKLKGVVTDGDLRRAFVNGISLDLKASSIMVKDPITVSDKLSSREMLNEMRLKAGSTPRLHKTSVRFLIVTDDNDRVVDILDTMQLFISEDVMNWTVEVIGLGFVGLTLAVSLANVGFRVIGVDNNQEIVDSVLKAKPHFHEVGLEPLLRKVLAEKSFSVQTTPSAEANVHIIAVGPPVDENGVPDLTSIDLSSKAVGKVLKRGDLVALRSTVPLGSSRSNVVPNLERESGMKVGRDVHLVFAPERTVEGKALEELRTLPQIVGGFSPDCLEIGTRFFAKLAPNISQVDTLEAAEMIKLINNTFRDVSFAFANELAYICQLWNLDVVKIINSANRGYGRNPIALPSPGVGGFCLTKDPYIYAWAGKEKGYNPKLPFHGREINKNMPKLVVDKMMNFFAKNSVDPKNRKVFVAGFAFKGRPETSDMRFSPTLDLIELLKQYDFDLYGYDPVIEGSEINGIGVKSCSLEDGFQKADCVLVMNNHEKFSDIDIFALCETMNSPSMLFDGWHNFSRDELSQLENLTYEGISGAL